MTENCVYIFKADTESFLAIAKEVNEKSGAKQDELDEKLLKQFCYNCAGDVSPMQNVMGGIAAQEVMKVLKLFSITHG